MELKQHVPQEKLLGKLGLSVPSDLKTDFCPIQDKFNKTYFQYMSVRETISEDLKDISIRDLTWADIGGNFYDL